MRRIQPGENFKRAPKAGTTVAPTMHTFDTWLQRGSHLSQSVLLLATLASLYFIVIPLYQKELLSEQIAKKEIELNRLQDEVNDFKFQKKAVQLKQLLRNVYTVCSGIMPPPEKGTGTNRLKHVDDVLEIDMPECFRNELFAEAEFLEWMTKTELEDLSRDLAATGNIIQTKQKSTKLTLKNFSYEPMENEPPLSHMQQTLLNLYNSDPRTSTADRQSFLKKMYLDREENKIVLSFLDELRSDLLILEKTWTMRLKSAQKSNTQP